MSIANNLQHVREEIAAACARAGRNPSDVALMAVSKTHPASAVAEAYAAGQRLFGENRVQEFAAKREELGGLEGCSFHLIGPLQNNKTNKAAELFDAIDSLAEVKTAERLNSAAKALGKRLEVLVEVKLSPEESKHGLAPEALGEFLEAIGHLEAIRVRGLMTVPPLNEEPRPYFQRLRQLREEHAAKWPDLRELSMGMSHDFATAIEEGSTVVRVGTAIFGSRSYA